MNISSNYDYYSSQTNSTQALLQLLQKRNTQGTQSTGGTSAEEIMNLLTDSNTQAASGQKNVSPLASLIEDGTITSDQEQAIKEALETARMAYQTQAGAANASGYDPLDSLVASGTITEDQKAAVKEALDSARDSQKMMMPPPPLPPQQNADSSDALISALDSLVEEGTITSEQQEYVMSAYESAIQAYSVQSDSFTDLLLNSFETEV